MIRAEVNRPLTDVDFWSISVLIPEPIFGRFSEISTSIFGRSGSSRYTHFRDESDSNRDLDVGLCSTVSENCGAGQPI